MNKINVTQKSLNLNRFTLDDDFVELLQKLNENFIEIQENGGGPMGPIGPQGESIPGPPGPQGPAGDANSDWIGIDAIDGCEITLGNDLQSNIGNIDLIMNKYSNKSVLLTNLVEDEIGLKSNISFTNLLESMASVNATFGDYKFKIYNSDDNGYGKHIHLLNSHLAETNNLFLCESGFTMSNDNSSGNIENLNIIGHKNYSIDGHSVNIINQADSVNIKNTLSNETLKFTIEKTTSSTFSHEIKLKNQTTNNLTRLPDKTGWNATWVDTTNTDETWDVIYRDIDEDSLNEIYIERIKYMFEGSTQNIIQNEDAVGFPFEVTDNSYIRFKRLNNWVLIDYRIEFMRKASGSSYRIKDLVLRVNTPTIGCKTISWLPGTFITEESIDYETDNYFSHFRIDSCILTEQSNAKSFKIANKFTNDLMKINDTKSRYFISGQAWATIEEYDPVCEMFEIISE